MKKIAALLFLIIYGSTSVGATLHMHYCMNELVGWNLWDYDKDKECSKCGMKEIKGGCCKDEYVSFKINIDQNKTESYTNIQSFTKEFYHTPIIVNPIKGGWSTDALALFYIDPPPVLDDRRLHIFFCVFLI